MTENRCEDDELMMMVWWQRQSEWLDIYTQANDPLFTKKVNAMLDDIMLPSQMALQESKKSNQKWAEEIKNLRSTRNGSISEQEK